MSTRCAFCNASVCFGEVTENGKTYHDKCAPSKRVPDPDAPRVTSTKTGEVPQERQREYEAGPKTIGTIQFAQEGDGRGRKVDPRSGKVTVLEEGRFANPRVGKK